MKPNNIYNTPIDDQIKRAIFEQIADESQIVNAAVNEIKSKIQLICNSRLSKEMKRKKLDLDSKPINVINKNGLDELYIF